MKKSELLDIAVLSVLAIFLFFFWAERIPVWSSDEGRYAEIAREMWVTGDFVVPHFNYVDYLEKPVFAPWVTALCYEIFGVSHLSTRLSSILAALAGIGLCYVFARRLFNRETARLGALLLTLTIGYVLVGRFAIIDMLLTFLMNTALFCFMAAYFERKKLFYLLAYVLMGLSFLTKGLIGIVLPGLVFCIFLLVAGDLKEIKNMKLGWGALIISVIVVPWIVAISIREPEFIDVFILQHHFRRFTSGSFGKRKPFWFFLPIVLGGLFPWSLFLPAAGTHYLRRRDKEALKFKFLLIWIATIFFFFSIPATKLAYYMLPLCAPAAILIGAFFAERFSRPKRRESSDQAVMRWSWRIFTSLAAIGFLGLNTYVFIFANEPEFLSVAPCVVASSLVLLVAGGVAYFLYARGREKAGLYALMCMNAVLIFLAVFGTHTLSSYRSSAAYANFLNPHLTQHSTVAVFSSPDHFSDFPFHLRRRVVVVGSDRGTLTAESNEPEHADDSMHWFVSEEDFIQVFQQKKERMFCLMETDRLERLEAKGLKEYQILKAGYGHLLIGNTTF